MPKAKLKHFSATLAVLLLFALVIPACFEEDSGRGRDRDETDDEQLIENACDNLENECGFYEDYGECKDDVDREDNCILRCMAKAGCAVAKSCDDEGAALWEQYCGEGASDGDEGGSGEGALGEACRGWMPPCDPSCDITHLCWEGECKEILVCEPECELPQVCNPLDGTCIDIPDDMPDPMNPCNYGLVCNWETGICEDDPVILDGDEITDGDGLVDGDNPPPDGDDEPTDGDDEPTDGDQDPYRDCDYDEDCSGAFLCNEENECEVLCSGDYYNEDCPGAYDFVTRAFGICEPILCNSDNDCLGLEACDNPEMESLAEFYCDEEMSQCIRGWGSSGGGIGAACTGETAGQDCNSGYCLDSETVAMLLDLELSIPGGYCSVFMCSVFEYDERCHSEIQGSCFSLYPFAGESFGSQGLCTRICDGDSDCRELDDQSCFDPQWFVEYGMSADTIETYFPDGYKVCLPDEVIQAAIDYLSGGYDL